MLTASIEAALVEEGLVGATWALVAPEGTTIGAAGLNDASRERPMSPDDRVQVGSVAKTLVATGVLALVTQGRIDLDAPLARYLPEVPIENRWESGAPLRDGLTHPGRHTAPAAPSGRAFLVLEHGIPAARDAHRDGDRHTLREVARC